MAEKLPEHFEEGQSDEQFRSEQAGKVVEFLERTDAYDYVKDILSGKEKVPDFERFKDFITRINGIARDIPISERQFDGVGVGLTGFATERVPRYKDKEGLFKYAYKSIPDVNKEDLKYMLPAVINAVHFFNDGNGRTSRILHSLLSDFLSEQDFLNEVRLALEKNSRYDTIDINPGLVGNELKNIVLKNHGWVFKDNNYEGERGAIESEMGININEIFKSAKSKYSAEMPEMAKDFFELYKTDTHYRYCLECVYNLLGNEGVKSLFSDYNGNKMISALKMVDKLKTDDWEEMIDNFWQLKKEHVEALVDIFREPDKYKRETADGIKNVKDVFVEDIKKRGNFI